MALTNQKSAVIQIDPHQLMSLLSTAAANVLGIKIRNDRFYKPEKDTFFELAFQARRIRVTKVQVKNDVEKFIILGQDIIELFDIEAYYIKNLKCVNKQIPNRTAIEYKNENKEKIKQYRKLYNNINKEKIKQYQNPKNPKKIL